jgi:hypothetical protein
VSKKKPTGKAAKAAKTAAPKKTAKKAAKKSTPKPTPKPPLLGINDINFKELHEALEHFEGLLNGVVGRTGSLRASDIRDRIRAVQADINCQSTMIVGF